ncbi:hypothetical protein [Tissierella praeacuta]|uniref:hypothetical protein n=1 Tax=Tissierella praeacuta TaxID=43131 RepID=UPI0028ADEF0A|nr:hypothetical protein [Tissierella praeacuta]
MKKHKISISFAKNYEDVYEFLIKKPNISQFICEVVREKMFEDQSNSLEEQVEKILNGLLAERGLSNINISSKSLNTIDILKNEDKDLIDSLF